jgi:hypothetical protein
MPFRVPGLDLIDVTESVHLLAPSSPERPFQKGAEMITLKDPILTTPPSPNGIELPPLREPESLETPTSYVSSAGATVMTSEELAEARSAALPPLPRFDRFGERVCHMTGRFVLSGSSDGYRIRKFQSAEPPIEFPVTKEGWALAWSTFRRLESEAA